MFFGVYDICVNMHAEQRNSIQSQVVTFSSVIWSPRIDVDRKCEIWVYGVFSVLWLPRYMEQSTLLLEKRNIALKSSTEQTQAKLLQAEQDKVRIWL